MKKLIALLALVLTVIVSNAQCIDSTLTFRKATYIIVDEATFNYLVPTYEWEQDTADTFFELRFRNRTIYGIEKKVFLSKTGTKSKDSSTLYIYKDGCILSFRKTFTACQK